MEPIEVFRRNKSCEEFKDFLTASLLVRDYEITDEEVLQLLKVYEQLKRFRKLKE